MSPARSINPEKIGLPCWMDRVLDEYSKVDGELSPEPVHDLRVALRRCIVIADIMRDMDPTGDWKTMRKSARRVFVHLGALRDTQVRTEWIEKLRTPGDSSMDQLLESLKLQHEKDRAAAQEALKNFDRKQWRAWSKQLSGHYRHVAANRPACESLIFEAWETVHSLHRRAQKSRSRVAYHRLRGGLKKFRYAVENFLPSMYPGWAPDLKIVQDLLGEAQDLSVLEQAMVKHLRDSEVEARAAWRKKIEAERMVRVRQYREKMAGKSSPLWVWREGLTPDRELRSAGVSRLSEWAYFATPDVSRVRRVSRLSMQLYDGLSNCGLIAQNPYMEGRSILQAAALLQEVGRLKKGKAHHKESYRMIRKIAPPAGWSKRDMEMTALIARFHRRALPRPDHKILKTLDPSMRQWLILLAAILRFANAFQSKPYRAIRRLTVEDISGVIVVRPEGFSDREQLSPKLSAARRLLEFTCQRAVHILAPGTRLMAPRVLRPVTRSDAA